MSQINEGPDSEKLDAYYKKIKAKSSHDDGDSKHDDESYSEH